MLLYHGTDVNSALSILNDGLDASRLLQYQQRVSQLGPGFYTCRQPDIAWFFASMAPGNRDRGYTVVEMEIEQADLERLMATGMAIEAPILNVAFPASQVWFALRAFESLNRQATFRPFRASSIDRKGIE